MVINPFHKLFAQAHQSSNMVFMQKKKKKKKKIVAFPWVETSTELGGFMICVFII